MSPVGLGTSQPASEAMVAALEGQERDAGIGKARLHPIADHLGAVKKELAEVFGLDTAIDIDTEVLSFQIPGAMLSNLLLQMKAQGRADKYPECQ